MLTFLSRLISRDNIFPVINCDFVMNTDFIQLLGFVSGSAVTSTLVSNVMWDTDEASVVYLCNGKAQARRNEDRGDWGPTVEK